MKLYELGEEALLREIRAGGKASGEVAIGIGDDAAALVPPSGEQVLLTVDALVEGTHFTLEAIPPRYVGRKAASVSVSDIAAMGGRPLGAVLSLVVRGDADVSTVREIIAGVAGRGAELEMPLVGGNLARSDGPMVVDVTVVGATESARALTRDGARPGDGLFVSGRLGAAACGLKLLQAGAALSASGSLVVPERLRDGPLALAEACIRAHLEPEPRLVLGRALNRSAAATACLDLSDGLSTDSARLCRASGVRARIEEARLPISPGLAAWERSWGRDPVELALSGGEDYELLFTSPDAAAVGAVAEETGVALTRIGEILPKASDDPESAPVELVRRDGTVERLGASGWDHFRPA